MQSADGLQIFPQRGRMGIADGTYELVLSQLPYILVYAIKDRNIVILRVLHMARLRPQHED